MALFCENSQFFNNQNNAFYLSDAFTLPFLDSEEMDCLNAFCFSSELVLCFIVIGQKVSESAKTL
ncbi:putative uncharacterized protein [Streptococcus troglodytae]|uniref:Uncharacterized protein n=1 Tax=Streptococcus troglodytae TaxID=1111760 RepID=A0A1L7LK32_9STRE|nr:putative uncharacterized protein [Streptococcus troglodytae]